MPDEVPVLRRHNELAVTQLDEWFRANLAADRLSGAYLKSLLSGTGVFNSRQGIGSMKVKGVFGIFRFQLSFWNANACRLSWQPAVDCRQ